MCGMTGGVPLTGHVLNLHVSTWLYFNAKRLDFHLTYSTVVTIKDESCNGTYSCADVAGEL
jgi:hypothetical protein